MRDSSDYYNLLSDTFRSSYHQVATIYNKIPEAKKTGRLVNIRTGYLMNVRYRDPHFFVEPTSKYPLCWNFTCGAFANYTVIRNIFQFYVKMLDEYDVSKNEEIIQMMYIDELGRAKENMDNNRMIKNNDDFELHDEEGDGREYSRDSDTESAENSFIDDDEIEEEEEESESEIDINKISDDELELLNNKKPKKLLKKKRFREEDFINEEQTHEETDLTSKLNSTAKKSNIIDDED